MPGNAAAAPAERLTLAAIVTAAERLVATEGVDGLSMRKLAKVCDVGVMTLYGYVRTKDDLLAAMADRVLADLELPAPTAGHWTYRVAAVFHALRRALLERPELVPVVAMGRVAGLSGWASDLVFLALRDAGLDEVQIAHALNAMTSFTMGTCQREIGLGRGPRTRDTDAEFAAGLDLLITGLRGWVDEA